MVDEGDCRGTRLTVQAGKGLVLRVLSRMHTRAVQLGRRIEKDWKSPVVQGGSQGAPAWNGALGGLNNGATGKDPDLISRIAHPGWATFVGNRRNIDLCHDSSHCPGPHQHCSGCSLVASPGHPMLWPRSRVNPLTFQTQDFGLLCDSCFEAVRLSSPPGGWLLMGEIANRPGVHLLFDGFNLQERSADPVAWIDLRSKHTRLTLATRPPPE